MRFQVRGKMSTFGGPDDSGVSVSEGLALVEPSEQYLLKEYFLPSQPAGTTGLARRLNPKTFYVACRWDYSVISKTELVNIMATVSNPATQKSAEAKPVDWGPNETTCRVADLSPGLAEHLGLETGQIVEIEVV